MYIGEIAALATALCWAFTSTSFESAGKKLGTLNLNLSRLLLGLLFISTFTLFTRGYLLPTDASLSQWFWLLLSGLVGVVIGDLLLFEAFVKIGSRISMLIYSSVPIFAGLLSWLIIGEVMTLMQIIGMLVTVLGIGLVIFKSQANDKTSDTSYSVSGILFAFGGAIGQALGYIIGKFGMANYDAFAATQIRILAGIISFIIIFSVKNNWSNYFASLKNKAAYLPLTVGSFFGPFLGISLSLYAVQKINPGVASTLIATVPILLLPYAYFIKKESLSIKEIVGTFVAIIGVAIIMIK